VRNIHAPAACGPRAVPRSGQSGERRTQISGRAFGLPPRETRRYWPYINTDAPTRAAGAPKSVEL
jgi:hypothetical protein